MVVFLYQVKDFLRLNIKISLIFLIMVFFNIVQIFKNFY